jgi:hypothetical protein
VAPPAAPHCTIWQFLGVDKLLKAVGGGFGRLISCLGMRFPGLEPKPPLLPITDPANLQSPNPAVKSAAAVKAEEDAAPQKIKALNYLATVGCGCYPEVKPALLAALDDCTESVRFAAVSALRDAAGIRCEVCRTNSCCDQEVINRLQRVATELTDEGCYKEPSARVRRVARQALRACQGIALPGMEEPPLEGGVPETTAPPEAAPPQAGIGVRGQGSGVRPALDELAHEFDTTPIVATPRSNPSETLATTTAPTDHRPPTTDHYSPNTIPAAEIAAQIDDEVITRQELAAAVKDRLALRSQQPGGVQQASFRISDEQQELERLIDRKLVWLDARRHMTATDLANHTAELERKFDAQVAATIAQKGIASREALDAFLKQHGTSLEQQRRAWCEEMLAAQWLQELGRNAATMPASPQEELAWYAAHHADFHRGGRQLSLDEVRDEIQRRLRDERLLHHRQRYLGQLRSEADIRTIFDRPVTSAFHTMDRAELLHIGGGGESMSASEVSFGKTGRPKSTPDPFVPPLQSPAENRN